MLVRIGLLMCAVLLAAITAEAQYCSPEYSGEQCLQMGPENSDTGNGGGNGAPGCPYYMCGNAFGKYQAAEDWCEATQSWVDCAIEYCEYQPCIGSNCYTTWSICGACSSRGANHVHVTECPRK